LDIKEQSTMSDSRVIPLEPDQRGQAVEVLAAAFQNDPGYTWIFPDPERRAASLRRYWDSVIGLHALCGEIYATADLSGVACWLPPTNTAALLWCTLRTGFASARALLGFDKDDRNRLVQLVQYATSAKNQVIRGPAYTLSLLGVLPECQGQGIGSALLRHRLSLPGADAAAWYLDTDTERNVALYERHGFMVVHEGEIPGAGMRLYGILRRPTG
jgi:GNAT superfamily N-acetyltransferase